MTTLEKAKIFLRLKDEDGTLTVGEVSELNNENIGFELFAEVVRLASRCKELEDYVNSIIADEAELKDKNKVLEAKLKGGVE